ncbi:MAG: MarR family transcriptional regulator [Planctomycetota bacterium]|nr:MAG: MarR family transcriptional regulator [Planctomycetota bacterium]
MQTTARHFDSLQQEVFLNLWRTYDRLRILEDELFGRYELTAQQYNALRLLRGVHPQKVQTLTLGARLVSRGPGITRLLNKLKDRGLIDRERPADNQRVVKIGITEAGLQLLADLDPQVLACHQRQLGHLPEEDLNRLIDLLRQARRPHEKAESDWM